MRHVQLGRRRFLETYRYVAFILQLLSCIATVATFVRVLEQHRVPRIFLILPLLLFALLSINRCVIVRDRNLVSILCGSVTGFVSGFLSTVVVPDFSAADPGARSAVSSIFATVEFLHLPVVAGTVMYTFCLMFARLPQLTVIILSVATGTCGAVIFTIVRMLLAESAAAEVGSIPDDLNLTSSVVVFLVIFILAIMPAMSGNRQAWLLCVAGFGVSLAWQAAYLDSLQWNWVTSWFPIPGFLSGLVTLFLLDVVDFRETTEFLPVSRTPRTASEKYSNIDVPSDTAAVSDVTMAVTWHAIAYVVERMSLTIIMENRGNKSQPSQSDAWLCSLGMIGVVSLFTYLKELSQVTRLLVLMLGVLLYVCMTVANGHLANGFFIDSIFGIALLTTSCLSDYVVMQ